MSEVKQSFRVIVTAVSVVFFLLTVSLQQAAAQQVLSDTKKKAVEQTRTEQATDPFEASAPKEETSQDTKKWLMYGGAAALVIGVAAAAAGGGGGGSSTPACEEELVGPDLGGSNWAGTLDLYSYGSQPVTAIVTHCGNRVLIQTTSTLEYGQQFEGTIKSSGYLDVVDAITLQEWTSHRGNASSTQIKIYDFVNDFHSLDSLELYRTVQ